MKKRQMGGSEMTPRREKHIQVSGGETVWHIYWVEIKVDEAGIHSGQETL